MTDNFAQPFADIVFNSTRDGVFITDAENHILAVNPAFSDITGFSREEVIGKSPTILKSGRQDQAFYQVMWDSIETNGRWQGEIWDRRKNGDIYLAILTVTVIKDENGRIARHVAVFTDINYLHESEHNVEHLIYYDPLTELPNRVLLSDRLEQAIARAKRNDDLLATIYIDLDHFKKINDRYGHSVGDRLIVEISKRLRHAVRGGDTVARLVKTPLRSDDTVARMGGDEFALIISGLADINALEVVLNRICKLIALPCEIDGRELQVTASLGVTVYPFDSSDPGMLLRHADQAMYQAKEDGRNRFHLFDATRDQQAHTRRQLLERLNTALLDEEFVLHYQPKVNLRDGSVFGLEALIRWQHPEEGLRMPGEFLPHIEHDDLIIDIGEWVICSALRQITAWHEQGLDLRVSVNIAARQLLRSDFVDRVKNCMNHFPLAPHGSLELEILESSAIENTAHVRTVMQACQSLGIRFALDDFGTGYASLTYLKEIPAEILKIDQSFIRHVLDDPDDLALVEGVIGLASSFRRIVVAEGVETAEQGVLLMRLGCDMVQGFGIARPMPAEQVVDWVSDYRPDPQWALWADTKWEMIDFPLLVAQYDHLRWVHRVAMSLEEATLKLGEAELIDHHHCRFGNWYYGHGMVRYGHLKAFQELEDIHREVHKAGTETIRLREAGRLDEAHGRMGELLRLKDRILEQLAALQASVAGKL